ncbi:MAG: hypothetical protein ACFFB0_03425 [Promethearchaeota archaeon]
MLKLNEYKIQIILLALVLTSIRIIYIFIGGLRYIATTLTIDDTYYYLNTAWNTKNHGFVTFDALHSTNGVQFLWFLIVYIFSFLTTSKDVFLIIILILDVIIMGLCFIPIWSVGIEINNDYFPLVLSMVWFIMIFFSRYSKKFFMGMENAIHSLIIWFIILYFIRVMKKDENLRRNFLILTSLLILNVWTRYDSIIFAGVIYLFILFDLFIYKKKINLKMVILSISLIIIGMGILILGFYLMGGSVIPISAKIKTTFNPNTTFSQYLFNIMFINTLEFAFREILSAMLIVFLISLNLKFLYDILKKKKKKTTLKSLIIILTLSNFIYSLIIGYIFNRYYVWYLSLSFILWACVITYIITIIITGFQKKIHISNRNFNYKKKISYGLMMLFISTTILRFNIYMLDEIGDYYNESYSARYNTAIWLKSNTNAEDIIGSWNAGIIGFFSERRVINLDGLINSHDYYERILLDSNIRCYYCRFNSSEFVEYLNDNNVSYIVDYKFHGFKPWYANFTLIKEFPCQGCLPIQVWARIT